jgi:hypothetical protein
MLWLIVIAAFTAGATLPAATTGQMKRRRLPQYSNRRIAGDAKEQSNHGD